MEFGVALPNIGPLATPETLHRLATEAEAMGFSAVFLADHIVYPLQMASPYPYGPRAAPYDPHRPLLEPIAALCYLAGVTRKVRLGISVLVLPYRHPVLATKMLTTLDVLSGGRVIVGTGVGWMREEFDALGASFEDRGQVADEWIEVYKVLCTQAEPRYKGAFFKLEGVAMDPKPVQQPHPPLWVGGTTPPAMERAALAGDGWHAINLSPESMAAGVKRVRRARRRAALPDEGFVCSLKGTLEFKDKPVAANRPPLVGSVEQVREDVARYRDAGVQHLLLDVRNPIAEGVLAHLRRFATQVMAGG